MKKLVLVLILMMFSVTAFADEMLVKDEGNNFVNFQTDRNSDYRNFLNRMELDDIQARLKLEQYKNKLSNLNERIYSYKDRITRINNKQRRTMADLNEIDYLKERMTSLVDEHDKLLSEIKQWAGSLK